MAQRVEIPAYTDRWMMGDRYGEVVKYWPSKEVGDWDSPTYAAVYRVKLDKSGKRMNFLADDCREV